MVRGFLGILLPLLFCRLIPDGSALVLLGCAVYALRGSRQTIEAFAITFIMLMASSAWIAGGKVNDLRWLVLICGAFSMFREWGSGAKLPRHVSRLVGFICVFCVIQVLINVNFSQYPAVSGLKLISFGLGSCTLLVTMTKSGRDCQQWVEWFAGWFAGLILAGGLCLLWGGGYLTNGTGFEGAFSHPQANGVVMGVGGALMLGQYLLAKSGRGIYGIIGLLCLLCIFMSQSRTGGFAMILSGGLMTALLWLKYKSRLAQTRLFKRSLITGFIVILGIFLLPSQVGSMMEEYVSKGKELEGGVSEVFTQSRQSLVDLSMANYAEQPVFGIGFGVPSSPFFQIKTVMGIPLGASVEKGFLPTAVLEETGLVGAILVSALIIRIFASQLEGGHPTLLWATGAAITMNLGEAMFFSIGGLGLFVWLMIALAIACPKGAARPKKRLKQRKTASPAPAHS
ncbi:hypothetical protein N9C66_02710 [Akkermansiaceae bacterium]|nr:hypothetical protein [Akkermansiaceae bacterium]